MESGTSVCFAHPLLPKRMPATQEALGKCVFNKWGNGCSCTELLCGWFQVPGYLTVSSLFPLGNPRPPYHKTGHKLSGNKDFVLRKTAGQSSMWQLPLTQAESAATDGPTTLSQTNLSLPFWATHIHTAGNLIGIFICKRQLVSLAKKSVKIGEGPEITDILRLSNHFYFVTCPWLTPLNTNISEYPKLALGSQTPLQGPKDTHNGIAYAKETEGNVMHSVSWVRKASKRRCLTGVLKDKQKFFRKTREKGQQSHISIT